MLYDAMHAENGSRFDRQIFAVFLAGEEGVRMLHEQCRDDKATDAGGVQ